MWHMPCSYVEAESLHFHPQKEKEKKEKTMKPKFATKTLIISAAVLLLGAAMALAHGGPWGNNDGTGMGYGMMGNGMGPCMMGNSMGQGMMNGSHGRGFWGNLTDEQRDKLQAVHEKFLDATQSLRDQIQDARYALHKEMNKPTPDDGKVATIQKDLSKLEGEFDQKAVQHQLEMRKLLPENARRNFTRGFGGGNCWQQQ
jgi:zinc resistance-associated protein